MDPEIDLICLSSLKLITEFEFWAKKVISGNYGAWNSQNFMKIAKNFWKSSDLQKINFYAVCNAEEACKIP